MASSAPRLRGKEKLKIALRALPAAARRHVATAIAQGAADMVSSVKFLCPVGDAAMDEHPGELRDSIGWLFAFQDQDKHRVKDPTLAAVIFEGGAAAPHVLHVEFGTQKMDAIPHFGPGIRAVKKQALARVNKAVRQGIKTISG